MTLRQFLDIYKSANKLYIDERISDDTTIRLALFKNIKDIPNEYLDAEVVGWRYDFEIVDMERIVMIPIAEIKKSKNN